jgi:hypothetical protein
MRSGGRRSWGWGGGVKGTSRELITTSIADKKMRKSAHQRSRIYYTSPEITGQTFEPV